MPSFLSPLLATPGQRYRLVNQRTGGTIATELITAFDSASRRTGLLKHDAMPDGAAMIIAPCNAVHTFRMRFAIDIAFVAKDGQVLDVRHGVGPWRVAMAIRAFAVVELAAGTLADSGTVAGDVLLLS